MSAESMLLLRLYGQTGYLPTLSRSLLKNEQPTQRADPALLTRRQWLGRLPAPAIAATLGAGFLGENNASAAPAKAPASTVDLGTRVYNVRSYGA